ncbi:hypothetical protein GWI33_017127 [Rhynchophorus ferrugineus]|uniref:Uncharacterized protein n=1 Tax=Rhynchophorus ferrugineus TaxID=354439 RepID=A0A834HXA9_RHYFE|nr:hypothetical protein GWI33_017127 [Rhynchophorus ferrugineus]
MWNMMCDVMPTISEDSISQRSSQFSGEDANFEQLMVSMLDERDKLMDSLRETQERLGETELKLAEVEKERDSLQRQIAANLPQSVVSPRIIFNEKQLNIAEEQFDENGPRELGKLLQKGSEEKDSSISGTKRMASE